MIGELTSFKTLIIIICGVLSLGRNSLSHHIPAASVIISSYNMAQTLPASLDSILNQTFSDFELIVIDDGSSDNTQDVFKRYCRRDSRIHCITNKKNLGLIASLNKGLKIAKGKYIVRLDADDTSYPNRLERQIQFMDKYSLDLSCGAVDTENNKYQKGNYVGPDQLDTEELRFQLLHENIYIHSASIFRRSFLNKFNLSYSQEHPNAEDYDLWVKIAMNGGKLAIMGGEPVTTYHYSGHGEKWWKISDNSVRKTRMEALRKIIPNITDEIFDLPLCQLLSLIIQSNKTTQILDHQKLTEFELKHCFSKLAFKHPYWSDNFVFLGKDKVKRKKSNDAAIIERIGDIVVVKWENWPTEKFKCSENICEKVDF